MLKKHLYLLLAVGALALASCAKESSDPGPGPDPGPQKDIVDQVSQYDAAPFDGTKRAGVYYEIFVRSFADSDGDGIGDLNGVTAKLDYLDDMGVGGIWLMPVFLCNSYHGYDVIDYRVVNPDYGTNADLEKLISEAHKRKIRVILDFVPNHSSSKSEWFTSACSNTTNPYRGFYHFEQTTTPRAGWYQVPEPGTTNYIYHGAFDRSMPDLNYGPATTCENNDTFKAMVGAAKFWIDKGVDGFRLDAVKHIYDNETSDENPTFLKKFYNALNAYFAGKSALGDPSIYMVGECWTGIDIMKNYYRGLPALFYFDGWSKYLSYAINNSHAKWLPKDLLADHAKFSAIRSDYIMATKLSNHDEDRARTTLNNAGLTLSLERAKIAAAVMLTVSGSPYIYYGEELGMLGSKQTGDHNVREPMLWAPKAEDTYRTTWTASTNNNDTSVGNIATHAQSSKSLYNVYRKFMRLRNTYPALATGKMELPAGFNDADVTDKQVMAFYRTQGSERLLVLHNVAATQSVYTINERINRPIADMNTVSLRSESATKHVVTMPAYSTIIILL